jgi:hypothetical protein
VVSKKGSKETKYTAVITIETDHKHDSGTKIPSADQTQRAEMAKIIEKHKVIKNGCSRPCSAIEAMCSSAKKDSTVRRQRLWLNEVPMQKD